MSSNASSPRARSRLAADIRDATDHLRSLVSGLDPKNVPLSWAPEVLTAFVEAQRVAESGRLLMTGRAAEAGLWERDRFASAADWLAKQQGTSTGRARADLETSERLDGLDATSDAVREGRLSPEQAGAVSGAAAVNPAAEADLLDTAQRESLRHTQREADRRKAEAQSEADKAERDERVRKERNVRAWYSGGAGFLQATGPVADIKELEQVIARAVDQKFREHRAPETRQPRAAYAFDALMEMGRGGSVGGSTASKAPVTRLALIRVDLAALKRGAVEAGEVCEIGGVAVSVTELRRLLGHSMLELVLTNGEAVIDVVNLHRKPTVAQKIAALFANPRCSVEGCERAVVIEFDHNTPWATNRETRTGNLDPLCDHDHDRKTRLNWQLVSGTGRRPMVPPTDPRHPDHVSERAPVPAVQPTASAARVADLVGRLARIKQNEAVRQAERNRQDSLFDTG